MTKASDTPARKGEPASLGELLLEGLTNGAEFCGRSVVSLKIETTDGRVQKFEFPLGWDDGEENREDVEAAVMDAVSKMAFGDRIRGKELSVLADRPFDSYFRTALSRLYKNSRIVKDGKGYGRTT